MSKVYLFLFVFISGFFYQESYSDINYSGQIFDDQGLPLEEVLVKITCTNFEENKLKSHKVNDFKKVSNSFDFKTPEFQEVRFLFIKEGYETHEALFKIIEGELSKTETVVLRKKNVSQGLRAEKSIITAELENGVWSLINSQDGDIVPSLNVEVENDNSIIHLKGKDGYTIYNSPEVTSISKMKNFKYDSLENFVSIQNKQDKYFFYFVDQNGLKGKAEIYNIYFPKRDPKKLKFSIRYFLNLNGEDNLEN